MSLIRMCDGCGNIFSELSIGWESFAGTKRVKDEHGYWKEITELRDLCGPCSVPATVTPKMPLEINPVSE